MARAICFLRLAERSSRGGEKPSQTGDCASRARAALPNLLGAALQFLPAETNTAMSFDALYSGQRLLRQHGQ
jgi:hypothetical protein